MIGIVIPCFNRLHNLKLCLRSLEQQSYSDFEVVISDDGSNDGTREFIEQLAQKNRWKGKIRWVGCGPHNDIRTGRARNIGAANLSSKCKSLLMLDSDVILGPDTVATHASYIRDNSELIVLGRVDWLPRMELRKIESALLSGSTNSLRKYVPYGLPMRVEGTFVGRELRESIAPGLWTGDSKEHPYEAQFALPLNSCYPLRTYWKSGGHDEKLYGYGFQDMVFGCHVEKLKTKFLACSKAWALHIWHPKMDSHRCHFEAQKNLDYLIRKFNSNSVFDGEVDWKVWWHYHAARGGRASIIENQVWVVNCQKTYRLHLPQPVPEWLQRLCLTLDQPLLEKIAVQSKSMGIAELTGVE